MEISGVILTGGKSSRLGQDKALLKLNAETLLEIMVKKFKRVSSDVILVGSKKAEYPAKLSENVTIVEDIIPKRGPLAGILTGLELSQNKYSLVAACDMPFIGLELVKHLMRTADDVDAVVPQSPSGVEPLCALYSKSCIPAVRNNLKKNNRIVSFFSEVKVKYIAVDEVRRIDPNFLSFFNINTAKELEVARTIWKEESF